MLLSRNLNRGSVGFRPRSGAGIYQRHYDVDGGHCHVASCGTPPPLACNSEMPPVEGREQKRNTNLTFPSGLAARDDKSLAAPPR